MQAFLPHSGLPLELFGDEGQEGEKESKAKIMFHCTFSAFSSNLESVQGENVITYVKLGAINMGGEEIKINKQTKQR